MTKKEQKELDGLGLMQSFGVVIISLLPSWLIDRVFNSLAIDLFVVFFNMVFLLSIAPRITGIIPPGRGQHAKQYRREKEPDAIIRDFMLAVSFGLFMGFLGFIFGHK